MNPPDPMLRHSSRLDAIATSGLEQRSIPKSNSGLCPRSSQPRLSLVVPVYNEQESIFIFLQQIREVIDPIGLEFEIVFVNDGSKDGTLDKLIVAAYDDPRILVISLSRNFGKEAALSAGLDHTHGDIIVPIDVDLQDPPELIPVMVERWREGYDVVYGVRTCRDQDSKFKRVSAEWFYRVFNRLTQTQIPENAGDFRLMDRRVVEVLKQLPERNRFMKGLFAWVGFKSIGVPYERPKRYAGQTKWNHYRLWNFALDGLASFSSLPLRFWTYVGAAIALFAFLFGAFIILRVLIYGIDVPGYASLMTVILFLGGIQLISIGILGEYLSRVFVEVKMRPLYVIDKIYGKETSPQHTVAP